MIDLPQGVEAAPVETFEDVTGELSRLIAHEPRPRRHTTQPPPLPRPTPNPHDEPLIGDWRIGFELGRGGMGAVYAASHREFGKRAALKISHTSIDGGSLGAKVFHREARVVQLIDHPAMPDIFATGTHEGRPYLVMERLRGDTLTQLCDRGAIDREKAFELLLELCDVLAAAHDAKVVHRDLKLDNIFVLETPLGSRIKLLDWGFAYLIGEDDPLRGMIAGTLSYVAPEQVLGAEITPACDIYSLGVVAYRLLLGQSPFAATSDVELVCRHLKAPPPHPAMLWPDIPKPLSDALIGMLAKEPLCRPTLAEVRAAFVAAKTPPRRRRFTRTRGIEPLARPVAAKPTWARRVLGAVTGIVVAVAGAAAVIAS